MRIRTLLALMAVAILLPVVLAAGIALDQIREGEREAALRGLRETARATSLIVDREVQGSLSALKALGQSPSLKQGDLKAFYAEAAALNQLPDVWTFLLDETGTQVLNTLVPFGTPPPPPISGGAGGPGPVIGQAGGEQPAGGPGHEEAADHRQCGRGRRPAPVRGRTGVRGGALDPHGVAAAAGRPTGSWACSTGTAGSSRAATRPRSTWASRPGPNWLPRLPHRRTA